MKFLIKPTKDWGPLLNEHRREAGYPELHLVDEPVANGKGPHPDKKVNYTAYSHDVQVSMNDVRDNPPPYPASTADKTYC